MASIPAATRAVNVGSATTVTMAVLLVPLAALEAAAEKVGELSASASPPPDPNQAEAAVAVHVRADEASGA